MNEKNIDASYLTGVTIEALVENPVSPEVSELLNIVATRDIPINNNMASFYASSLVKAGITTGVNYSRAHDNKNDSCIYSADELLIRAQALASDAMRSGMRVSIELVPVPGLPPAMGRQTMVCSVRDRGYRL